MAIVFILLGALALTVLLIFNGLVAKRNRCDNAFASIDVMLKRRYDLIPNLVETVKGYARHEAAVLREVTKLRARAQSGRLSADQTVALNNRLTSLIGSIMVVVEAYPELKANESFLQLQRALNETEEQIAAARRAYNAAVADVNNAVQMFPGNLVAGTFGFRCREFLHTPEEERAVPSVAEHLGHADPTAGRT